MVIMDLSSFEVPSDEQNAAGHAKLIRGFSDEVSRFIRFVRSGKPAIMIAAPLPGFTYRDDIGSSRRRYNFENLAPWRVFRPDHVSGSNIVPVGSTPAASLISALDGVLRYNCVFRNRDTKGIAHVRGHDDEVVAVMVELEDGLSFPVIPNINVGMVSSKVVAALNTYAASFVRTVTEIETPDWASAIAPSHEQNAMRNLDNALAALTAAEAKAQDCKQVLRSEQDLKLLLYGHGHPLEDVVMRTLTDFGLTMERGKRGHADLTGRCTDLFFAFEVQGVVKGAKADHVRSTIQWVQDIAMETGNEPKGVYIVNAYRDIEPRARLENPWSGDIPHVSKKYGICTLTTSQLFAAHIALREGIITAEQFLNSIATCDGPLEGYEFPHGNATIASP